MDAYIKLKTYIAIVFFLFSLTNSYGQSNELIYTQFTGSKLDSIRLELTEGNKAALFSLAPYLDSAQKIEEFLDEHVLQTTEKSIAKRLLLENCLFLESEINVTNASCNDFLAFLKKNDTKLYFDKSFGAFLITPLENRNVDFKIRMLTQGRKKELKEKQGDLLDYKWVRENKIDSLIQDRDPLALLKIAAEFYKRRNRFDYYQGEPEQYLKLLQLLTGTEIGVDDEHQHIEYFIDKDYDATPRLNLLIYIARNYKSYSWDNSLGAFYNKRLQVDSTSVERTYFQLLNSKDDSVAMHSFVALTTCDPAKVSAIADEFEKADVERNWVVPIFPYRFLKQMTIFTAYCGVNNVNFKGSKQLMEDVNSLKNDLSVRVRRRLEDKMIKTLSPDEITAFEYWCMIYEQNDNLTYSAGRILDIYYSNNWRSIIRNNKQLNIFLKKSLLFSRLEIIGICNKYLFKFTNSDSTAVNVIKSVSTSDADINSQKAQAIAIALKKKQQSSAVEKSNGGNYNSTIKNLREEFFSIVKKYTDSDKRDEKVSELLSKINYHQIGLAMEVIKDYKFKRSDEKYNFLERDFGFFMTDFDSRKVRNDFLFYYRAHSEKGMYMHYLALAAIDYTDANHEMDYDKIYELLKYDVVTAFVGGGGGIRDNEVYMIVKLLELKFNTTLGFPVKLCNSNNMYACDSSDRANEWMVFLREKKLLKLPHNAPQSISFH